MTSTACRERLRSVDTVLRTGRVCKIMSTQIEASGPHVPLGTLCTVAGRSGSRESSFIAEVVRVDEERVALSPLEDGAVSYAGALVTASAWADMVPVGEALLGRVVDSLGRAADSMGPIRASAHRPLHSTLPAALERISPREILQTGVRAIDGLLTLGKGQRIGIFAASGVGKTSLITQLARQMVADVLVLCLVGERGREVEKIWTHSLDAAARARTTVVAATSDQSAAMRVRAAHYALAVADHWRAQGKHVLLVVDSATRLAMALREIGLAAGEPPTVRAYTPNIFAVIPKMVERCGALRSGGAITAVLTVLSETDENDDPVCELMKSLLDGHILLSRNLAEQAHFPAIDVCRSISRQAEDLVLAADRANALQLLEWLGLQQSSRTLIEAGLYVKGTNPRIDKAVERHPSILQFLKQDRGENTSLAATWNSMTKIAGNAHA